MAKKDNARGFGRDRISGLPDHIIDCILKRLSLREAVRTSILSREWKYKWISIPHLIFDRDFVCSLHGNYDPESVVDDILALHKGTVAKFTFWDCYVKSEPGIDRWLRFLSNHPIEDLHFLSYHPFDGHMDQVSSLRTYHMMPDSLFTFDHLKHLSLKIVEVKPPPSFKGFHSLVTLNLEDITIEPKEFTSFISKCPMLELLYISNNHYDRYLGIDIDAPKLKSFSFLGQFGSIYIENSNIEEISIYNVEGRDLHVHNYEMPEIHGHESNLIKVFHQLSSIKRLESNNSFLQYLAVGGVPQVLPINLDNLTFVRLTYMDCGCMDIVSCALCLIRNTPNLNTLDISFENEYSYSEDEPVMQYLKAQQKSKIPLSCLKNLRIGAFAGTVPQVEFVKLLLLSETVLGKLEMFTDISKEEFQIVEDLTSFLRSPSKVIVIIN